MTKFKASLESRMINQIQILGFHFWLVKRLVSSGRRLLSLVSILSLIGMTLGVACLVVAMAVTSGFENTLKRAVVDVFGHVLVVRQTDHPQTLEEIVVKMRKLAPTMIAFTPFFQFDGVLAFDKRITGVVVQGLELGSVDSVLNVRSRVIQGKFDFASADGTAMALIGKGIAKKFSLKVGDEFKIVLPSPSKQSANEFSPKVRGFRVAGVLDLGKNEYDERYIVTDLKSAQSFAGVGDNFSGIRLRLKNENQANQVAQTLAEGLGSMYWTMSWKDVNKNLFEAIGIERAMDALDRADLVLWLGPEGEGPNHSWDIASQIDRPDSLVKRHPRQQAAAATVEPQWRECFRLQAVALGDGELHVVLALDHVDHAELATLVCGHVAQRELTPHRVGDRAAAAR